MKRNYFTASIAIAFSALLLLSFQTQKPLFEKNGIKIYEMKGSSEFPEAQLELKSPDDGATLDEGKDTFNFEVKNYQLGAQTPDADQKMCANSAKGQHIHFIMDNAPYVASYNPQIVSELKAGDHVLLAFLSRSYHESIKTKKAYILKEFYVPMSDTFSGTKLRGADYMNRIPKRVEFDEKAPHLFSSRPKGEYIGDQETKKVMLDFYLVNCTLSAEGYKVRATINGSEFTFTKWAPYIIEGLPLGETKIKLELLDKSGTPVKSPYNGTERTIILKNDPSKN